LYLTDKDYRVILEVKGGIPELDWKTSDVEKKPSGASRSSSLVLQSGARMMKKVQMGDIEEVKKVKRRTRNFSLI
jgi:hypothetical protein